MRSFPPVLLFLKRFLFWTKSVEPLDFTGSSLTWHYNTISPPLPVGIGEGRVPPGAPDQHGFHGSAAHGKDISVGNAPGEDVCHGACRNGGSH